MVEQPAVGECPGTCWKQLLNRDRWVAGSNPAPGTDFLKKKFIKLKEISICR